MVNSFNSRHHRAASAGLWLHRRKLIRLVHVRAAAGAYRKPERQRQAQVWPFDGVVVSSALVNLYQNRKQLACWERSVSGCGNRHPEHCASTQDLQCRKYQNLISGSLEGVKRKRVSVPVRRVRCAFAEYVRLLRGPYHLGSEMIKRVAKSCCLSLPVRLFSPGMSLSRAFR